MVLNPAIKIGGITASTTNDEFGRVVRVKLVKYLVNEDGPFTLVVTPDIDNQAGITAALNEQAATLIALRKGE
jgi:hypothetical protein